MADWPAKDAEGDCLRGDVAVEAGVAPPELMGWESPGSGIAMRARLASTSDALGIRRDRAPEAAATTAPKVISRTNWRRRCSVTRPVCAATGTRPAPTAASAAAAVVATAALVSGPEATARGTAATCEGRRTAWALAIRPPPLNTSSPTSAPSTAGTASIRRESARLRTAARAPATRTPDTASATEIRIRASRPIRTAVMVTVSAIPTSRACLSRVPNSEMAQFFNHCGVIVMNHSPKALAGDEAVRNSPIHWPAAASSSAKAAARPTDTTPRTA